MILLDYSQIANSTLSVMLYQQSQEVKEINEGFLRHLILNTIRSNYKRFKSQYGELVIACDAGNYWRKDINPYYKALRVKAKEESALDWKSIHESWRKIKHEIKDNFQYRVVESPRCEADDVIATLCHEYGDSDENILILSGDRDFVQLHKYSNVSQYDPTRDKWIKNDDPEKALKEKIIRGDTGDGVCNFLSDIDSLVLKKRQKSVMQKKLDVWLTQEPEEFCDENQLRRYRMNEQLVSLFHIPEDYRISIYEEYEKEANKNKKSLMNYFIASGLKNLIEDINDFI